MTVDSQYAALKASIAKHGIVNPVIKDQTGYVLDGHQRLAIAAELDILCPEVVRECDPDQREIIRFYLNHPGLWLNRIHHQGEE